MNIFKYTNYKNYIRDWVESQKSLGIKVTYSDIASAVRIQKTYLSKVINDKTVHLNSDQSYLIAEYLGLSDDERVYFDLLLSYRRTTLAARRREIKEKIDEVSAKYLKPEMHIKATNIMENEDSISQYSQYYLDPWNQIIHIALTIPKFQKRPIEIAKTLNIPEEKFQQHLNLLSRLGIISLGKKVNIIKDSLHLSRQSPLFWSWHKQITTSGLERSRLLGGDKDLNFSVTFTADSETFNLIKANFLSFMESCQKSVEASSSENLYQLNFDLINWEL
jgi:uncharacterized protein (TIGR02147 family)